MANYFTKLSLKLVIFADAENVKEVFFLTPFGSVRRCEGKWVLIHDQREIDRLVLNLNRHEVDFWCTSEPKPANEIPSEHEIVVGFDLGQVSISEYKRYLYGKSESPSEQLFPDTPRASKTLMPFAQALEESDHLSVRQRFLLLCEGTPIGSEAAMGHWVAENLKSRPEAQNLQPIDLPKMNQLAKTLEYTIAACCNPKWYVTLKEFGPYALPQI